MGLRTGPIQEGSQPGPRLDRKARARKDPKAQWGFKRNQACIFKIVPRHHFETFKAIRRCRAPRPTTFKPLGYPQMHTRGSRRAGARAGNVAAVRTGQPFNMINGKITFQTSNRLPARRVS